MYNLKYNSDYNYKYCINATQEITKPLKASIILWRKNNRMSYLRCLQFLQKFCKEINITNIRVKTRTKKIKNYAAYEFDFAENWNTFLLLQHKLPEPEITVQASQYTITYNFYKFLIEIPVAVTDHNGLMKMYQLLPLAWQDI